MSVKREHWATKIGLILAMAGNAIGLGNFIRFPAKAAAYGGGAYLIPYFIALILLGIPIMFVEWVLGRYGGIHGHGHLGPMLYLASKRSLGPKGAFYYAVLGGAVAFVTGVMITGYYTNIIGWMGFYAISSISGAFVKLAAAEEPAKAAMGYLVSFLQNPSVNFPAWLISLLIITLIVSFGVRRGIEIAAKIMMPILFLEGIILVVLSLTLGAPVKPEWTSIKGFEWLWMPRLEKAMDPKAFIEGAGQIFFTLSIGIAGIIPNYASYLRREDDIPLSALTTTSLNEFAEVVMGASIAIPLAYAFGGPEVLAPVEAGEVSGFILSVSALPPLFGKLGALGSIAGFLWFSLLWFAGTTSAIALVNVVTAIFEEDFGIRRRIGAWLAFAIVFLTGVFVNLEGAFKGPKVTEYLDTADFWAGSLLLLVVALFEVIAVIWLWGDESYEELHRGAFLSIPKWYWIYVAGIIAPIYLVAMLIWFLIGGIPVPETVWGWIAIGMLIFTFILGLIINYLAITRRYGEEIRRGV